MTCGGDYNFSEREKNEKVSSKFLYAITSFSIFNQDESYWLEYIGDDTYVGRSDNILNKHIKITPFELDNYFSTEPRTDFEKILTRYFYTMRTWGMANGESNENFCDRHAHMATKNLLQHLP